MIKFFRHIRQKLLAENPPERNHSVRAGRFTKYLIYAIGEIILVVIGILIALQINNWNLEKSNNRIVDNYLARISNEISADIESFNNLQNEFSTKNKTARRFLEVLNSNPLIIENPRQFRDDFFDLNGISPWFEEPIAWTQLVQSGELKLVNNQRLVETLMTYYANIKDKANGYAQFPTEVMIDSRRLLSATIASRNTLQSPNEELLNDNMLQYIISNKQEFKELAVRTGIIANNYASMMDKMAESGKEALLLLKGSETNNPSNSN